MQKISGVYCIENMINHKKYIGQSTNINKRLANHKSALKNNRHTNEHLQNSWNTYSESFFIFYIIEECEENLLDEKERFYIAKFDCMNPNCGYNFESGGNKNKHLSDEVKNKLSISNTGRTHSEETKQKIRDGNLGKQMPEEAKHRLSELKTGIRMSEESRKKLSESRKGKFGGRNNPMYGKIVSEETRKKQSLAKNSQPIYCLELDKSFYGASEASRKSGANRTSIIQNIKGIRKSAGKHPITGEPLHWSYIEENNT